MRNNYFTIIWRGNKLRVVMQELLGTLRVIFPICCYAFAEIKLSLQKTQRQIQVNTLSSVF